MEFTNHLATLPPGADRDYIRSKCRDCLVEGARQVRNRLPSSLNSLRLLESLSPAKIIRRQVEDVQPLLMQFRHLTMDSDSALDEFNNLPLFYGEGDANLSAIDFWTKVSNDTDPNGNGRFKNISTLALKLFSLPFSNASVERVFSFMSYVKSNIRNRLGCDTVDAIISVRYGLRFCDLKSAADFIPPNSMLKLFTSEIYDTPADQDGLENANGNELVFEGVYEALDALEAL